MLELKKLIGLENFIIEEIIEQEDTLIFVGYLERKNHICPRCNSTTREVKDIRIQLIKDIPAFGKNIFIKLKKQRYICRKCSKSFYEENNFLQKYQRNTNRVLEKIFEMASQILTYTYISKELNMPISTLIRKFDLLEYPKTDLKNVEVLAIDEFKGNTGGEKYNCILADPKRKIVLDILPKRYKPDLQIYFFNIDKNTRDNIKIFISDMWQTYFDIAKDKFKNSKFVVDKYHWVIQGIWAFENVRKKEQKNFSKEYRKYFKRSKSLLTKKFDFLKDEEKQQVNIMLYHSEKIRMAHDLKEEFFKILECKDREEAKKKLTEWIKYAQSSGLKAFKKCADTFVNWSKGILNSFDTKYTNGFIEGCNNKIKVLKRISFGCKNFNRFRNRILHIFNY